MEKIGSTDLPCVNLEDDLLGTHKYAEGLAEFIANCLTPMSIAIQGDWGTGKTSIINYVRKALEQKNIKPVYFNTWQYAQFNMSDNLYFSFLSCLLKEMGARDGEGIKKIKESILMAFSVASNVFLGGNGLNKEDMSSLVKQRDDMAESVAELKKMFAKQVSLFLKNEKLDRMVIFVDDLDRLNPNVAVELLEIMKLFMDVEKCVFVLAIDYGVVVQGVRQKFGQDVSLVKCRSFFDKIIQLPFHMPVENYHLNTMIEKQFPDISKQYIQDLAIYAKNTIGTNPRTFKRLCNSFRLIQLIKMPQSQGNLSGLEQSMLFCALCVQMNCPELHGFMASSETWYVLSENKSLLEKDNLDLVGDDVQEIMSNYFEKNEEVDWDGLANVLTALDVVLRALEKNIKITRETFLGVLRISGITSVASQGHHPKTRADAIKVNCVEVLGKRFTVDTGAKALKVTFQTVLEAYPENVNDCIECLHIVLSREEKSDGAFRSKIDLNIGDTPLYLGTSISMNDKLKSLDRLVEQCRLMHGNIRWLDGETCIYPRR